MDKTLNPGADVKAENVFYESQDSSGRGYWSNPISEKRSNAMYVLKLKQQYKLAQTTVDGILGDTEQMTERVVTQLQQCLLTVLSKAELSGTDILGCLETFEDSDVFRLFNGLNTQYLQEKYFQNHMGLVVSSVMKRS